MGKFSTRVSRRFSKEKTRNRAVRPKTFASKELADVWAKKNNVKDYKLENMRNEEASIKKIRIVMK